MAEVKHKKPGSKPDADSFDPSEFEEQEEARELVVHQTGSLAQVDEVSITAQMKPMYVSVVHGVGKLNEAGFSQGELVLDKEVVIYSPPRPPKKGAEAEPDEPALVTVLSAVEFYKEHIEYGTSTEMPRTWASEAEAMAAGMITKWPKWGTDGPRPNARPAINFRLLIKEPEGVEDRSHFFLEIGDSRWAPATLIADKMGYMGCAEWLTATMFAYKELGIKTANCALSTRNKLIKSTGNFTKVPEFQVIGPKTADEIAELVKVLSEG